jgi:hypothetical protein
VGADDVLVYDEQRKRLRATIEWAGKLRAVLQATLDACGERVHFRPASTGIAMVGLLAELPQRGKGRLTNLDRVARDFEALFAEHCQYIEQGRVTGEKALQSFLIRDAYTHGRRMAALNDACADGTELVFVTDEIALPVEGGKMVCDILALRRDRGRNVPVLLELKDDRMLTRLVQQVTGYAALIDAHADLFAELYGALLGERVVFAGPTEKWIVWPAVGDGADPREAELGAKGIRVVGYKEERAAYALRVGSPCAGDQRTAQAARGAPKAGS